MTTKLYKTYTAKDLSFTPKKVHKYTPIPVVILFRCKCCGEMIPKNHEDWNICKNLRQPVLEHRCSDQYPLTGGHVIGMAEHVGYAFFKEVKE